MSFVTADLLDDIGALTILIAIALAVITDKLVWHTRLKRAEARAERWEQLALEALTSSAQASVAAAEVTADVVRALPDPARRVGDEG